MNNRIGPTVKHVWNAAMHMMHQNSWYVINATAYCSSSPNAKELYPVAVVKLHDGNLHAVGWGEGPGALVTPVKAIRVGVGL